MQAFMQSLQIRWPVAADEDLERGEREALALRGVELGDLLVERAARERDAERALLERRAAGRLRGGLLAQALCARILALRVAPDAVIRLVEGADEIHARIGQLEAIAAADAIGRDAVSRHAGEIALLGVHGEIEGISVRRLDD